MMASAATPKRGRKLKSRKFYRMGPDLRSGGATGWKLENESLLLQGELALGPPAGRRGFPEYPEPPRFLFDKKLGRLPRDIEQYSYFWAISDPMKRLLEAVDSDGFAFARCEVRLSNGEPGPAYWLYCHRMISPQVYSAYVAPAGTVVGHPYGWRANLVRRYLSLFGPITS